MAILPRTFNARTVKEERAVTDYIKNKIKDYPRIEDAFEAGAHIYFVNAK